MREALSEGDHILPLRLLFQSPLSSFHDSVVATENFVIMATFGNCLVSAFFR